MNKKNFSRPLIDDYTTNQFLLTVLNKREKNVEFKGWKKRIIDVEKVLNQVGNSSTYDSKEQRCQEYKTEEQRLELRKKIIKELLKNERLDNDEQIKLGKGGILPKSIKMEKQVYILIGSPASGKSTIANKIAESTGSVILDSDYVKRKLPEFKKPNGASLVHKESSFILFGDFKDEEIFCIEDICISYKFNIIIPTIGDRREKIENIIESYIREKYSVHLILVSLEREVSTQRAFQRFLKTGRYVPLSLVFDVYGNDPILCYYRLKNNEKLSSYGKVSTLSSTPRLIESSKDGIVEYLYKEEKRSD